VAVGHERVECHAVPRAPERSRDRPYAFRLPGFADGKPIREIYGG
jgi:hypothetical protein